jgi:hypothetical protein
MDSNMTYSQIMVCVLSCLINDNDLPMVLIEKRILKKENSLSDPRTPHIGKLH